MEYLQWMVNTHSQKTTITDAIKDAWPYYEQYNMHINATNTIYHFWTESTSGTSNYDT